MTGNERSSSRLQLYEVISDLLYIRVNFRPINDLFNPGRQLVIQGRNKLLMQNDDLHNTDFEDKELSSFLRNPGGIHYNFVLKSDVLKEKDKLLFDIRLDFVLHKKKERTLYSESRTLSLQSLLQTKKIEFTSLLNDIKFDADIEIFQCKDVKSRNDNELCKGEKEFISKRKKIVCQNIRQNIGLQNHLLDEEDAPNIAIIGSGGGMRAVIGMCGAMTALKDIGILDCTMYTAGVSGSAWYLMALYGNNKQHNPKELNAIIRQKLAKFQSIEFIMIWYHWKLHFGMIDHARNHVPVTSIADSFGKMIGNLLLDKDHLGGGWCEQKAKLNDGLVPLPLLAALHVRSEKTIKDYNEWIEFSPYEMYMPKYGAAIDMNKFGDQFYGGFCVQRHHKTSIMQLQGICGSGFAKVRELRPKQSKWYMFWSAIRDKIGSTFDTFDTTFVGKVPNWLLGIQDLKPLAAGLDKDSDMIDLKSKKMMLVDAGIAFNSPYPTVLQPSRKTDLIVSFDFSQRKDKDWPFRQLEEAERWARQKCVPFPKLYPQLYWIKKEWNKGNHKEMYVFEGDNSPTIVHFVTINKSFRKACKQDGAEHDFNIYPKYWTFRFYYSEQDFNTLCLLIQHNVRKNRGKLARTIQNVINQKKKRKMKIEGRMAGLLNSNEK